MKHKYFVSYAYPQGFGSCVIDIENKMTKKNFKNFLIKTEKIIANTNSLGKIIIINIQEIK